MGEMPQVEKAVLYKNNKAYDITDTKTLEQLRNVIKSWFDGIENPIKVSLAVNKYDIIKMKAEETAVELYFKDSQDKKIDINFRDNSNIFIPITGNNRYYIYSAIKGIYQSGPISSMAFSKDKLKKLDDVINSLPFKDTPKPSSTTTRLIPLIDKMVVYSGGKSYEVTDNKEIEQVRSSLDNWFKGKDYIYYGITDDTDNIVNQIKSKYMSIELFLSKNQPENIYYSFNRLDSVFIPMNGDYSYYVFECIGGKYQHEPMAPLKNKTTNSGKFINDVLDLINKYLNKNP